MTSAPGLCYPNGFFTRVCPDHQVQHDVQLSPTTARRVHFIPPTSLLMSFCFERCRAMSVRFCVIGAKSGARSRVLSRGACSLLYGKVSARAKGAFGEHVKEHTECGIASGVGAAARRTQQAEAALASRGRLPGTPNRCCSPVTKGTSAIPQGTIAVQHKGALTQGRRQLMETLAQASLAERLLAEEPLVSP